MFVVRTRLSSLGTPRAQDALAYYTMMSRAGNEPTVTTIGGRVMAPARLERWIATMPRRHLSSWPPDRRTHEEKSRA